MTKRVAIREDSNPLYLLAFLFDVSGQVLDYKSKSISTGQWSLPIISV